MNATLSIDKPITFGLIVSSRAFFNPAHALTARKDLLAMLASKGYSHVIGKIETTPDGAVATLKDADAYAALFKAKRDEIDGIIVSLANFGDEIAVTEAIRRSGLRVPVLLQACNDDLKHVDVKGRRDSYCGKISVANNFYQCGIKWTDTTEHTEDLSGPLFAADVDRFAGICRTVRGLTSARIGAIGARPMAFRTVRYSEKLLESVGISVVTLDLSEIFGATAKMTDSEPAVAAKLAAIHGYGELASGIPPANIVKQAKLSVAIDRFMAENACDCSAIQCWNSVQENYGCATCLSMSMMGENLMPSACEVDVTGVVSMYALALATRQAPGFLDWNNNYGDRKDYVVCTHCSNFPRSFMGREVEIGNLDLLGETFGAERCFGAIKGQVAPGPFTFFRVSTDDRRGLIRGYLGEGEFTKDPFPMDGGIAVCRIANTRELMTHVTRNGFEHHVAMVRGQSRAVLAEAVQNYLGWELYDHR